MSDSMADWYSDETATFGDRLAGAREAAGMSRAQIAERLGASIDVIEAWEDNVAEPRSNRLIRLSGILNVSVMWLLNGEGDGVAAPDDLGQTDPRIGEVLSEIAVLQRQMTQNAERLTRLETRLRQIFQAEQDD